MKIPKDFGDYSAIRGNDYASLGQLRDNFLKDLSKSLSEEEFRKNKNDYVRRIEKENEYLKLIVKELKEKLKQYE